MPILSELIWFAYFSNFIKHICIFNCYALIFVSYKIKILKIDKYKFKISMTPKEKKDVNSCLLTWLSWNDRPVMKFPHEVYTYYIAELHTPINHWSHISLTWNCPQVSCFNNWKNGFFVWRLMKLFHGIMI